MAQTGSATRDGQQTMIEPVRLAPVLSRTKLRGQKKRAPKCGVCKRKGELYQRADADIKNATVIAVDWGNKAFCEDCYAKYKAKKKIERDSREEIIVGPGVTRHIISEGDKLTFPEIHQWVKVDYAIRAAGTTKILDSSAKNGKPLLFQVGRWMVGSSRRPRFGGPSPVCVVVLVDTHARSPAVTCPRGCAALTRPPRHAATDAWLPR